MIRKNFEQAKLIGAIYIGPEEKKAFGIARALTCECDLKLQSQIWIFLGYRRGGEGGRLTRALSRETRRASEREREMRCYICMSPRWYARRSVVRWSGAVL